jgi:hypothetical protein
VSASSGTGVLSLWSADAILRLSPEPAAKRLSLGELREKVHVSMPAQAVFLRPARYASSALAGAQPLSEPGLMPEIVWTAGTASAPGVATGTRLTVLPAGAASGAAWNGCTIEPEPVVLFVKPRKRSLPSSRPRMNWPKATVPPPPPPGAVATPEGLGVCSREGLGAGSPRDALMTA